MELFIINNEKQQLKVQQHLVFILEESLKNIKKGFFKKAFQLLDRFLSQHNVKNQLAVDDRIKLRRRSLYTLSKIFLKMILKNEHSKEKFQQVINRLGQLLDRQYMDICLCLQPTDGLSEIYQFHFRDQKVSSLKPSQFLINTGKRTNLQFEINYLYCELTRVLRNIGLYYHQNGLQVGAHYLNMSMAISKEFLGHQFHCSWGIAIENKKSQLALNCLKFEWGWVDKLQASGTHLEDQLVRIIRQTTVLPTPQIRYKLKKGIKLLAWSLLFQAYTSMDAGDTQGVHEALILVEWLVQSFIQTYQDEIKQFLVNLCKQLIPRYQEALLFIQEAGIIALEHFGPDHWLIQKLEMKNEKVADGQVEKQSLLHHYNKIHDRKYDDKQLNNNVIYQKPKIEPLIFDKLNKKNTADAELFHDLTTLDQISGLDSKRSSIGTSGVKFFTARESRDHSVQNVNQPRTRTPSSRFDVSHIRFDSISDEAKQIINFDFRMQDRKLSIKHDQKDIDIDLDRIMKKTVFKALLKHDHSKHQTIVQEQFNQLVKQNYFERKETDFSHKMLLFKRFQNQISPPSRDVVSRQALRLYLGKEAAVITASKKQQVVNESRSSHSSVLSFEQAGAKLTSSQKWKMIVFKHKEQFNLTNLRLKLKLRAKEKQKIASGKQLLKRVALDSIQKKPHPLLKVANDHDTLIRTQKKSKEMLLNCLKQTEQQQLDLETANRKLKSMSEVRIKHELGRQTPREYKFVINNRKSPILRKKFQELYESTKHISINRYEIKTLADLVYVEMARKKLKRGK